MNKKTKGLVAGAAGAALLMGGATFALWSDSDAAAGATITAGNLEVEFADGPTWRDVSDDRVKGSHVIEDISSFHLIPGDTLEATYDIKAALEGENLVAALEVGLGDTHNVPSEFIDVTYAVYQGEKRLLPESDLNWDTTVFFASEDNGDWRSTHRLPAALPADPNLKVVVTATISEDLPVEAMGQAGTFEGVDVSLTQTREGVKGYNDAN